VREESRDRIEDAAAASVEALISLIPGIGGPLAVLASRSMGSAFERRTVRILSELRDDLARLEASALVKRDPSADERETLQAATHRTIRQLLEAESNEKRALLRNALLNRVIGTEEPARFDDALERVQPADMPLLGYLANRFEARVMHVDQDALNDELAISKQRTPERLQKLIVLGLVENYTPGELSQLAQSIRQQRRGGRPSTSQPTRHRITPLGSEFVRFVANPIERRSADAP
jgi:hypothetical protein